MGKYVFNIEIHEMECKNFIWRRKNGWFRSATIVYFNQPTGALHNKMLMNITIQNIIYYDMYNQGKMADDG